MTSAGDTAATVAYQARGAGDSMASYIRQHPLQVAVAVGAFTWWMLRGRDDSQDWYGTADTSWEDEDAMSFDDSPSMRTRVGDYASTARETVGDYASTARETVGEYASTARDTAAEVAGAARERARRAAERARYAAMNARSSANDFTQDNPMAAGAIALAAGIAIGMAVPVTEMENRTMGEARDRAWERATQAASEMKENVTKKVENAAENFVNENVIDTLTGKSSEPMGRA